MRFLLAILISGAALAQSQPAVKPKLIYVVILSRHGVRSPTATNEALSQYAADPWPKWEVAPGELTEHGAKLMGILGAWYRGWLAQDGLLPAGGCEEANRVHVRADVDQRTHASGRAIAEGMFPGCGVVTHTVADKTDPLFHPVAAGLARGDGALASAAVSGRIGGHSADLPPTLQHPFEVLREVLFGCPIDAPCPAERQAGKQRLLDLPASVGGTEDGLADLRGPVRTSSTMAENLLLEYTNGMTGKDLGWGRLDKSRLNEVMAIHTAYADLARRTPYLARVQGSNLLTHMLRSMEQAVSGKGAPGALGKPGDRLLLLVGHDTNISHVSSLLNLSWLLRGYQRDDTPPGGSLVFRLWNLGGDRHAVEIVYVAQTLDQMRDLAPLGLDSGPATAGVFVPGCSTADARSNCDWESFRKIVSNGVDLKYVGTP